jgi:hypothetical protein
MKSPRITLSIALLLSLPAKITAADTSGPLPVGLPVAESSSNNFSHAKNYNWNRGDDGRWLPQEAAPSEATQSFYGALKTTSDNKVLVFAQLHGERSELPAIVGTQVAKSSAETKKAIQEIEEELLRLFYADAQGNASEDMNDRRSAMHTELRKKSLPANVEWAKVIGGYHPRFVEIKTEASASNDAAQAATVAYYQQILAQAPEGTLEHKEAMLAIIALQNPERTYTQRERELLASDSYRWEKNEEGYRVAEIETDDNVPSTSEMNDEQEEGSSGWLSYLSNLRVPALFASAEATQAEQPAESQFVQLLKTLEEEGIEQKNDVVTALRYRAGTHEGLTKINKQTYRLNDANLSAYYADAAVTQAQLEQGMVRTELINFSRTQQERNTARQGTSLADQTALLALINNLKVRMQSADHPGIKLQSALAAKTAEQRNKVLVELRALAPELTKQLAATRTEIQTVLNQTQNYALIFNIMALVDAAKQGASKTSDADWAHGLLGQFTGINQPFAGQWQQLEAFAQGIVGSYTSWYSSRGEPGQATALREVTALIPKTEALLAAARTDNKGILIDQYTRELAQQKEHQEKLFKAIQTEVIAAAPQLLAAPVSSEKNAMTLAQLCTQAQQLQRHANVLDTMLAQEHENTADIKRLGSMLALLTADAREEGKSTRDALLELFAADQPRQDIKVNGKSVNVVAKNASSHGPDYYFVRDTLAPVVAEADPTLCLTRENEVSAAEKSTYAEVAATSSSADTSAAQIKQPKKPARSSNKRNRRRN